MNELIVLVPWNSSIGARSEEKSIVINDLSVELRKDIDPAINIHGWYDSYIEGLFCFYRNNEGYYEVVWNQNVIKLDDVHEIKWEVNERGREFNCYNANGVALLSVSYRTAKGIFIRPIRYIMEEVFAADDYNCELPSWIESTFQQNKIVESYNNLIQRIGDK